VGAAEYLNEVWRPIEARMKGKRKGAAN